MLEIRELLVQLERRIKPLEWDASRNQINEFKLQQLGRLQKQQQELTAELEQLNQSQVSE